MLATIAAFDEWERKKERVKREEAARSSINQQQKEIKFFLCCCWLRWAIRLAGLRPPVRAVSFINKAKAALIDWFIDFTLFNQPSINSLLLYWFTSLSLLLLRSSLLMNQRKFVFFLSWADPLPLAAAITPNSRKTNFLFINHNTINKPKNKQIKLF